MADPRDMVPYNDPYDGLNADDILNLMTDRNPSLADLADIAGPSSEYTPEGIGNGESHAQFHDPPAWQLGDHQSTAGQSSTADENTSNPPPENVEPETWPYYDSRELVDWPISPMPFFCSCCQILRQILHTNGVNVRKLEIHGRLGMINHAILEDRPIASTNPSSTNCIMFDFCKRSWYEIKKFLVHYSINNVIEQYFPLPEAMSIFYDTLCVGMEREDTSSNDSDEQPPPQNPRSAPPPPPPPPSFRPSQPPEQGNPSEERPPARRGTRPRTVTGPLTSLASQLVQRQRTGKMTLDDMREYFHLPITEASRQLRMCPTVVKKICRRSGLRRWPHRKLESYQRKVENLRPSLNSPDPETRERAAMEIERLRAEITQIYAGVDIN